MKVFVRTLVALAIWLMVAAPAQAAFIFGFTNFGAGDQALTVTTTTGVFTIDAFDTGWYADDGGSNPGEDNYIICIDASLECTAPEIHDFFAFRLGTIPGDFLSASLSIFNPPLGLVGAASADVSLWDFAGDVDNLLAGTGGVGAFNDLGSGILYGSRTVTTADNNTQVIFDLSPAALAAISAALSSNSGSGVFVVGGAGAIASVPEPVTLSLLALGLAGTRIARFRRPRHDSARR